MERLGGNDFKVFYVFAYTAPTYFCCSKTKHINTAYLIKIDYLLKKKKKMRMIISYIHVQMSLVFFLCCDSRDLAGGSAKQNKKSYCLMMSLLFDLIDLNKTFTKNILKIRRHDESVISICQTDFML